MADRVAVSIVLGGMLSEAEYMKLAEIIDREGLSMEWDGPPFEPTYGADGEPLRLYAKEVAWGELRELEAWCVSHQVAFAKWCDGCGSQWGPQRMVFTGEGEPRFFAASGDDDVMINEETVKKLGSIAQIRAYFEAANFSVPPLCIGGARQVT